MVWLLAMISIVAVPKTINHIRKNKVKKRVSAIENLRNAYNAKYEALSVDQKQAILRKECGFVQLSDGKFYMVGKNYENYEVDLAKKNLILHYLLDNSVIDEKDPIHLIRKDEVNQIYSTLNNAQKRLIMDLRAAILRADDGTYFMITDRNSMKEYVLKYGERCSDCGKKARRRDKTKKMKE